MEHISLSRGQLMASTAHMSGVEPMVLSGVLYIGHHVKFDMTQVLSGL